MPTRMVAWDPDGAGPLGPRPVAAGSFGVAGDSRVQNVAMWDGTAWQALGRELTDPVTGLTTLNGELFASTSSNLETTAPADRRGKVWRWTGTQWTRVGQEFTFSGSGSFEGLTTYQGSLVAFGRSVSGPSGSPSFGPIVRWNGSTWQSLGFLNSPGVIFTATEYQNELYVGGIFTSAGSVSASNVARWSAANGWRPVSTGTSASVTTASVTALTTFRGNLVVAGTFDTAGGVPSRGWAFWNGSTFTPAAGDIGLFGGTYAGVTAIKEVGSLLYIAGEFHSIGGTPSPYLATWSPEQGLVPPIAPSGLVRAMCALDGTVYLVGAFTRVGDVQVSMAAGLSPQGVVRLGSGGFDRPVRALARWNGQVVALGDFRYAGGPAPSGVAAWNGSGWTPIGETPPCTTVDAAIEYQGLLVVGGRQALPSGVATRVVKAWNGFAWQDWSATLNVQGYQEPMSLAVFQQNLYAGGGIVQRWDGSSWQPEFTSSFGFGVAVFATESALHAEYYGLVYRKVGSAWTALSPSLYSGPGARGVFGVEYNNALHIVGNFVAYSGQNQNPVTLRGFARRVGSAWQEVGGGLPGSSTGRAVLKFGNVLYIAGRFPGQIAKWDGTAYTIVSGGIPGNSPYEDVVRSMIAVDGEIWLAGSLMGVGDQPAYGVARFATTCCDSIDFNNNGVFPEDQDVIDFFNVLAGAECPACNEIDFNNNNVFPEDADVIDFFNVLAGGTCGA